MQKFVQFWTDPDETTNGGTKSVVKVVILIRLELVFSPCSVTLVPCIISIDNLTQTKQRSNEVEVFVFWDAVIFLILFKQLRQTLQTQKHTGNKSVETNRKGKTVKSL